MGSKKNRTDQDFVRMFYEHQYDRMGKQEQYRLTITNFVLTISAVAFTFGYQDNDKLTVISGIGLPLMIIIVNIFAIATVDRTKEFIRAHRNRAHETLEKYAPEMEEINEKHTWPRGGFFRGRSRLQKGIHILLIIIALIPFIVYLVQIM